MTVTVIGVEVNPGKVARHDQIEMMILVEVDKGGAISTPPAFARQTRAGGGVREIAMAVVEQEVGREAVIGIVIRGGHLAAIVWDFVLTKPDIKIAVAIDITTSEDLNVLQSRTGRPYQAARFA